MSALTAEHAQLFLENNFGTVATVRADGSPHVTVVWLDWDGQNVLLNSAYGRAKPRNLMRDPRLTVTVFPSADPYQYVSVSGTAELIDEGAAEHITKLGKKYRGWDEYPLAPGERRVIIRVHADRVDAHGFGK